MDKSRKILGRVKWKPLDNDPESPGVYNWKWMWNEFSQNMQDVSSAFNNSNNEISVLSFYCCSNILQSAS